MAHWKPNWSIEQTLLDKDLFAFTTTDAKSGRTRYTYFFKNPKGNVLFHGPDLDKFYRRYRGFFDEHGGIKHHVFTHAPEVSPSCTVLEEIWGTTNWLHEIDVHFLRKNVAKLEFDNPPDKNWLPHLKAVHLPGHMPGFNGYLLKRPGKTYLISGDFIQVGPKGAGWRAAVVPPLRDHGFKSVEKLRALKFDAFLPNKAIDSRPIPWEVDKTSKAEILDQADEFLYRKFKIKKAS